MEVKKVKGESDTLFVELKGDTIGFANLIREELWNDENVLEAASFKEHPYMAEPKIFVKMKGKTKPEKALKDAASRIESKLKTFRKEVEGSMK